MASEWTIEYGPHAVRQFESLDESIAQKILRRVDRLTDQPHLGKPLKGKASGFKLRSLRVGTGSGEFRVIYQLWENKSDVLIVFVGSREDVYDHLERWLE